MSGCFGAMIVALGLRFQPEWSTTFNALKRHLPMAALALVVVTAVVVARHRAAVRADFAKSWLAALPVPPGIARRESLRIELWPAAAGIAAATVLMSLTLVVFAASRDGDVTGALLVWGWLTGACILGAVASYAIPQPKIVDLPPGSRYVPKGVPMRGRVLRPSLSALSRWPVRRMFAQANPKLVARALMPVLLMMGLGSMADTAMVVIGIFVSVGSLTLLIPSVIAVTGEALRWAAPLPLPPVTLLRLCLGRGLAWVFGASAMTGFLLTVMDFTVAAAIRAAVTLAMLCTAVILLGVWRRYVART